MEKEQLKARFFGMHIGCPFTHPDFEEPQELMGVVTYPIEFIEPYSVTASAFYRGGRVDIERCQLVLKHLSSITDEAAIECSKIEFKRFDTIINRTSTRITIGYPKDSKSKKFVIYHTSLPGVAVEHINGDIGSANQDVHCIDWMRSKGFKLPYMGFDPIAENWATIEETK